MSIFYAFVIFCFFAGSSGHSRFRRDSGYEVPSSCEEPKSFLAFNEAKYVGTWYSNGVFDNYGYMDSDCNTEHWTAVEKGKFSIVEAWFNRSAENIIETMITGRVPDSSKPEHYIITSSSMYFNHKRWILETDYSSYAVQYLCSTMKLSPSFTSMFEVIWIMTRERNPPQAVIEKALKFVADGNLGIGSYIKTNQTGCEILDKESNMDEGDENRFKK